MIRVWFQLFLLGTLCSGIFPAPFNTHYDETDPELTAGYFQGDMDVDYARNGQLSETRRWPNATVPYRISEEFGKIRFGWLIYKTNFIYNFTFQMLLMWNI